MGDCDVVLMHNGRLLRCKGCSPSRLTHQWTGKNGEFIEFSVTMDGVFRLSDVPSDIKDLYPDGTPDISTFLGSGYSSSVTAGTWKIYRHDEIVRMGVESSTEEAIIQMHIAARHMVLTEMRRGRR